ncbi:Transcriptional regulator, MerR family [hydrothermal vent metagenome]|uniref:Transcriptional regulator, MerR family n=1 Tax=hydrothermal vent metagenome TaxID=652676 RepID=A0A3B0ZAG4_9ZZZZ
MKVKDISGKAGVTTDVVRYYTRIGLLKPERSESNGYKLYTLSDLVQLRFIRCAKDLGFTLNEISEILEQADHDESPCPMVRDTLKRRIGENRKKLDELLLQQNRMEKALQEWDQMPDKLPDGPSVCHLIESVGGV